MPNITNLATSTPGTVVENKIPSVSNLVYNPKIGVIENKFTTGHGHDKYITTEEFNRLTSKNFTTRLKQENLGRKNDIFNFVKKNSFDEKLKAVSSNKNELNEISKKVKAISTK